MQIEYLNPIQPLSTSYTQMVKVSGGTLLGVQALASPDFLIEIEATAVIP